MGSFSWAPGSTYSPPGRLVVPREVSAWAELERAELVLVPSAAWNTLGTVVARARVGSARNGERVVRVSAMGTAAFVVGPICAVLGGAALGVAPAAGMPLMVAVPIAVVLFAVAGLVLVPSAAEVRAGPLLEVEGRVVRVPRLGLDLGPAERLDPLVLKMEHAVRYDDGQFMQRYCIPAVWHEGGGVRRVVALPMHVRQAWAEGLVRRALERPAGERVRVVEISSEERRKGSMPTGD